jgi:hypothetical protein
VKSFSLETGDIEIHPIKKVIIHGHLLVETVETVEHDR